MPLGANKAAIMGVAGVSTGDVVLLSNQTASGDSALSFTGMSSTYGEYIFKFYNINPATDDTNLSFQFNASGESGYNETVTTTFFRAKHDEADSTYNLAYVAGSDLAQATSFQQVTQGSGNGADESSVGEMHIFNPSSTTYVTHFNVMTQIYQNGNASFHAFVGGYVNTTAAITDVQFKMSSGNFDGKIKMWGVK